MTDSLWRKRKQRLREFLELGDYQALSVLFSEIARDLYWDGKEFFYLSQKAMRLILLDYQNNKCVGKVSIMTGRHSSCDSCRVLDGKVYTVKDALREMPLPVKECRQSLSGIDHRTGFCNCSYVPHLDE